MLEETDDYFAYSGLNLRTGNNVYVLEGRKPVMKQSTLEDALQMVAGAFGKAHPKENTILSESFIDSDILYIVLQPEKPHQNRESIRASAQEKEKDTNKTFAQSDGLETEEQKEQNTGESEEPETMKPEMQKSVKLPIKGRLLFLIAVVKKDMRLILIIIICVIVLYILSSGAFIFMW